MPRDLLMTALRQTEDFNPAWTPASAFAHEKRRQRRLNAPERVFVKPEPVAAEKPKPRPEPLPNPLKLEPRCATMIRVNSEGVMDHWLEVISGEAEKVIPPVWSTTIDEVIHSVCEVSGLSKRDLNSEYRFRNYARARQACMFLLFKHKQLSTTKIGQLLGGRDHSTAIHGIRKVRELLEDKDPQVTKLIRLSEIKLGVPIHLCSVK